MLIQASAFALVHLAHYGLDPFQPELIAIWLPSIFAVGLLLGWIVIKSGSVLCSVVAHSTLYPEAACQPVRVIIFTTDLCRITGDIYIAVLLCNICCYWL